jgi:hypothetical protein
VIWALLLQLMLHNVQVAMRIAHRAAGQKRAGVCHIVLAGSRRRLLQVRLVQARDGWEALHALLVVCATRLDYLHM